MKKQTNRFLAMFLAIVIAAGMLPTTAFAASNEIYTPTSVYVTKTDPTDDDGACVTFTWKTTERVANTTNDNHIRESYLYVEIKNAETKPSVEGYSGWGAVNIEGESGDYVLKMNFTPEMVEKKGTATGSCTIRIAPGTTLSKIDIHRMFAKFYKAEIGIYRGKGSGIQLIGTYNMVYKIAGGLEPAINFGNNNILWKTSGNTSLNMVGLKEAYVSASNSSLPKSQTVSVPITVSAITDLGSDAALSYTNNYAKVSGIKYTGTDYGDSVYFSENNGQLYLNVDESIYDKIGNTTSIQLPFEATVKHTLTKDTATGSTTITLTRPTVTCSSSAHNVTVTWNNADAYYRIAKKATLTASERYELPDSITVKAGDKILTAGTDYTYDKAAGTLEIPAASVTGDINVEAIAAIPLGNINTALPAVDDDAWFNGSNSTLTAAVGWTMCDDINGTFSNSITLDGVGSPLTKTLYFKNGGDLYSYELTYNRDISVPVVSGIEDGKTYCTAVEATVSDDNLKSVTINGAPVTLADNKFTISPAEDEQTIVAADEAGNSVTYKVTVNDGHTLSYAANGNVITETCTYCSHKTTATITATNAVYVGGSLETASVAYSDGWKGGTLVISYVNNNGVGEAAASITKNGATASIKFNITAGSNTAPAGIGKTDETIDGKADGSLTGVNNSMEYRKDGETSYKAITGNKVEGLAPGTYYVRYVGNANYNASPDSDAIMIAAGRKLKVTFVVDGSTFKTEELSWNGKIDTLPQIPPKTGCDQTPPTWDKSLAELQKIQADVTVTAQYTVNSYGITLPAEQTGYTLTADKTTVEHGENITLTLTLKPGYSATDSFSVSANGSKVTMNENNGVYTGTVTGISEAQTVTVNGVADITAPDNLVVSYGTNSFKEFLNDITFGLFFQDTVTVTISAADAGSGVKEFTYRLGDGALQTVTAANGSATFTVTPEFKGSISEVTAVDHVGNKTAEKAYEYFAAEKAAPNAPSVDKGTYEEGKWTNESVTFTVSGSSSTSGIQKYQYSKDNGQSWQDMETTKKTEATGEAPLNVTEAKLTVTGDADSVEYIFRAVSGAGNNGANSSAVTLKIDTVTPTVSVSGDTDKVKTSDTVDITATAGISGSQMTVSKDGGQTETISGTTYQVTENGTYTFRVTNGAGVIADASITYRKIDTKTPVISLDSGDYTDNTWTNKNVTLTVENSTDNLGTDTIEYRVDSGEWKSCLSPFTVSDNTDKDGAVYTFRITAENGLRSTEKSVTLKIDTAAPAISVSGDTDTVKTSDTVSITAAAGISGYNLTVSKDGDQPETISGTTYEVTENGTYTFHVTNGAGVTADASATYRKIDTKTPVISLDSGDYTDNTWTNKNVTLIVENGMDNLGNDVIEYRVGSGEWQSGLSPFTVSDDTDKDGAVYTFRITAENGLRSTEKAITVKRDSAAPGGDIIIKKNSVKTFINAISFGLFFNDDVDVEITGNDSLSGVQSIVYHRSETILTEDEVTALTDWMTYTDVISETAEESKKFVYYAKITDNAGNVTILASDGVDFDLTAPVISGVTDGATYYTTQKVTVTDVNLGTVTLNGEPVSDQLTLDGNKNVRYEIIATDKTGTSTTVTVAMKPIASLAGSISTLTVENVKSSDKESIEQVKASLQEVDITDAAEAEKAELNELIAKCDALLQAITDVAAKIKELTDTVNGYAPDSVKSSDKEDIQDLIEKMDALISGDSLTADEKAALQNIAEKGNQLIDKINEASGDASQSDAIQAAEDITADNVSLEDKGTLEDALKDLTDDLENNGDNYTETEKAELQDKIDGIKEALGVIEKVETVKDLIDQLPNPEKVKLSDEKAIASAKDAYDKLSGYEKTLVDKDKLDKVVRTFKKLSGDTSSPDTGDNTHVALGFVLMLSAAFSVVRLSIYSKKKKAE